MCKVGDQMVIPHSTLYKYYRGAQGHHTLGADQILDVELAEATDVSQIQDQESLAKALPKVSYSQVIFANGTGTGTSHHLYVA